MSSITDLMNLYFITAADVADPSTVPVATPGNTVTPLIDGDNYFGALRKELTPLQNATNGGFFYFANWLLELVTSSGGTTATGGSITGWPASTEGSQAFILDPEDGTTYPTFIDDLATASAAGTDVRAFGWISPLLVSYRQAAERGPFQINAITLASIVALRAKPGMGLCGVLDVLAHPLGAMHLKLVVCGDTTGARAYVSGLDFSPSRVDGQQHQNHLWHDIGVKIEGPAVQGVYNHFQACWNEVLTAHKSENFRMGTKVPAVVSGTTTVPSRTLNATTPGSVSIQVLRTVPQIKFSLFSTATVPVGPFTRLVSGFSRPAWSFAPNGIFEFNILITKAIKNAQQYIYVEDQGYWSQPLMDALKSALTANPNLKLIMLHHADPADPPSALTMTSTAVNLHLAPSGSNVGNQIAFFERADTTVVHSKTWIIDDALVIIGSANCFRRSCFTDGELSVAMLDANSTNANIAIQYRSNLWAEHCGAYDATAQAAFNDLSEAITIWNPTWGIGGQPPADGPPPGTLLPTIFQNKLVPFRVGSNPDEWTGVDTSLTSTQYDQYDPDSTQTF